jgi:transposase InsO family protein
LLELRHLHAHHHSQSGTFAPVIKFDSDYVFEAAPTRQMCARMGVGIQFSAPYAHHMIGKAERPWRTIRNNESAMLHSMAVPNFMWSCVVSTVLYLRNRTYTRSVGLTGGVPLTLLTSSPPDASKFIRVFGCTVFAKVPDKLRRKLSEKAFRGVMVGYPPNAPGYLKYNPETHRITTSVHVVF